MTLLRDVGGRRRACAQDRAAGTAGGLPSSYRYNDAEGVMHLPLDWPLEPRGPSAGIKRFVELMLQNVILPPVTVCFGLDDRFAVVDGLHRMESSIWLNHTHIPARVIVNEGWREARGG
jgi:hypothetical protein